MKIFIRVSFYEKEISKKVLCRVSEEKIKSLKRVKEHATVLRTEVIGISLLIVWYFVSPLSSGIRVFTAFAMFLYLIEEIYFIFNDEYPKISMVPLAMALYIPLLAAFTFVVFVVFQYLLSIPVYFVPLIIVIPVVIYRIMAKIKPVSSKRNPSFVLLDDVIGKFNYLDLGFYIFGFVIVALTLVHFTYLGGNRLFVFADQNGYLSAIESFVNGGKNISNFGTNLVGQASFAYTSSTMTFDSFFFSLLYPGLSPMNIYIVLSGLIGGAFFYFGWFVSKSIFDFKFRIIFLILCILGFSSIGLFWTINIHSGAFTNIITPPFFQGVYFPLFNGAKVGLEQPQNDLFWKAIWHALPFLTTVEFFYFSYAGPRRKEPWIYLILTILEYWPIGITLLILYAIYLGITKVHKLTNAKALYYYAPIIFTIYFIFEALNVKEMTMPIARISIILNPLTNLPSSVLSYVIAFTGLFVVVYLDVKCFFDNLLSHHLHFTFFAVMILSTMLLFVFILINNGTQYMYVIVFILSLAILMYSWAWMYESSRPKNLASKTGKIKGFNGKTETRIILVVIVGIILILPTASYIEQPSSNVLAINTSAGTVLNSTEVKLTELLSAAVPHYDVTLMPLNLWYLGPLSNTQILTVPEAASSITSYPRVLFNDEFYLNTTVLNFSEDSSLNGVYSSQNIGGYRLVNNSSISSTQVLMVYRQRYTVVNVNLTNPVPLANSILSFSLFPTNTAPQPYDSLGVILGLSNGEQLIFQGNSRTQGSNLVVFLNLTANQWNSFSFNLSSTAKEFNLSDVEITSVSLGGGSDNVVYWKYFNLTTNIDVSPSFLQNALKNFDVQYILISQANYNVDILLNANDITQVFQFHNFILYKVS
jgi:hypothetical protein